MAMCYEIGTHIAFSNKPNETVKRRLYEVGEHIVFVMSRSCDAEIIAVR